MQALHRALCEGALIAEGQYDPATTVKEPATIASYKHIPFEIWQQYNITGFKKIAHGLDLLKENLLNGYLSPVYYNPIISTTAIDDWLAGPPENKTQSSAKSQTYITAVEAIIWIAYKKWLTYEQLFSEHFKQEDLFYGSAFSTTSIGAQRIGEKTYPYDIGKARMLAFAQRLVEGKVWTEEEWRGACGAHSHSLDAMNKCLQESLTLYGLSLSEFVAKLQSSITYEREQAEKLDKAEQGLLDAARAGKIAIRGKRKNGSGDIEDVPPGFLDRLDYRIALWGNKFIPSSSNWDSSTFPQLKQIEIIGWHELRVKKEDVVRLWLDQSVPVSPPDMSAVNQDNKLSGLGHYWNTDFSHTLKLSQNITVSHKIPENASNSSIIKFNIYQDHAANTKFIGFYIPAASDTYQICIYLAESYKVFMDEFGGSVHVEFKSAGDFSYIPSHELTFTGRVYIYHETELSHEQLGQLIALYREKNLHVQFRGSNYATTRWLQDKANSKDIPKQTTEQPERDYFNELKYAPEIAAARELKERQNKPFDTLPTPDWRLWGNIPMVPLWKVVALSLNVDPAALEVHGVFDPEFHGGLSDEFKLRLQVTIANQDALGIYSGMMKGYLHLSSYYLPVAVTMFFKWATRIGWKLPASFPNGISDNASGTGAGTAPVPTNEAAVSKPTENNRNNRGPKPKKTTEIKSKILDALKSGEITVDNLLSEKQENLASQYGASREIAVKARDNAISEYQIDRKIVGVH